MDWLNKLLGSNAARHASNGIEFGLCNAEQGDLGFWITWNKSQPTEVLRIAITPYSPYRQAAEQPFSFTFAPGLETPSAMNLEGPWKFKDFMRGKNRATSGVLKVEITLSNQTLNHDFPLEQVLAAYLGKGSKVPSGMNLIPNLTSFDQGEIANLPNSALKAHSEKAKKALEEKRAKEEEAKKAAEAAKAEAARKAADALKAKTAGAEGKSAGGAESAAMAPCKAAIVYGSSTGNTANVAEALKNELGASVQHCKNITEMRPTDFTAPEILIIGIPTWHIGELQDDWAAMLPDIGNQDFTGKKIAIFGLGDAKGYPDTYVDAMAEICLKLEAKGAKLFGLWPTAGYDFKASKAIREGKFMGLVIDVENQDNLTDGRVKAWAAQLRKELAL